MAERPTLYLSDISIAPGAPESIENLPELTGSTLADKFLDEGLSRVRVFTEPPWKAAATCARSTLGMSGKDTAERVVYASNGRFDLDEFPPVVAYQFLVEAGLSDSLAIGTNLQQCANFGTVLLIAQAFVGAGLAHDCLLVTVDSAPHDARLLEDRSGIFSDAAAAAMVSDHRPDGYAYEILGIEAASNADLALVSAMTKNPDAASDFLDDIEDAMARLRDRTKVDPAGYASVLVNNYTDSVVAAMLEIIDVPAEKAMRDVAAEYSHCHAVDGLIGLDHLARTGSLADGDDVLVVSSSPNTWFLVALRFVAG